MGFREGFKKSDFVPTAKTLPVTREPSFEECVEEFMKQYRIQSQIRTSSYKKAYSAYRRMFCDMEEPKGNNFANQKKLMKYIADNRLHMAPQISNGRYVYMHIVGEDGLDEFKNRNMEKLYLNCDRRNIALLTGAILKNIKDVVGDKLQMKCISEQMMAEGVNKEERSPIKNYQRNDKIVIYAENHEMAERIAQIISEIRDRNPELFSSQKVLPFIPKENGIVGIAVKKPYEYAKTPLGTVNGITYNDYIANLIKCCIVAGFDEAVGKFKDKSQNDDIRMIYYANGYESLQDNEKAFVMGKIRRIFGEVCKQYNVKTVYTNREEQKLENQR